MTAIPSMAAATPSLLDRRSSALALPAPSPRLREVLARAQNPHPEVGADLAGIPDPIRREAAHYLALLEAIEQQVASLEEWREFLRPHALARLPNGPKDGAEAANAVAVMAFAFHEMPRVILTAERSREGLQRAKFWLTPAEWQPILAPPRLALTREIRAARAVAAEPRSSAYEPPTDAQRAAILEGFAALRAELRASAVARETARSAPRTAHLTGAHLAAARDATAAERSAREKAHTRPAQPTRGRG